MGNSTTLWQQIDGRARDRLRSWLAGNPTLLVAEQHYGKDKVKDKLIADYIGSQLSLLGQDLIAGLMWAATLPTLVKVMQFSSELRGTEDHVRLLSNQDYGFTLFTGLAIGLLLPVVRAGIVLGDSFAHAATECASRRLWGDRSWIKAAAEIAGLTAQTTMATAAFLPAMAVMLCNMSFIEDQPVRITSEIVTMSATIGALSGAVAAVLGGGIYYGGPALKAGTQRVWKKIVSRTPDPS